MWHNDFCSSDRFTVKLVQIIRIYVTVSLVVSLILPEVDEIDMVVVDVLIFSDEDRYHVLRLVILLLSVI